MPGIPSFVEPTRLPLRDALAVIPAKAGIQAFQQDLDPGFRRGDGPWNLAPGFSCPAVTDRVMEVRRGDGASRGGSP